MNDAWLLVLGIAIAATIQQTSVVLRARSDRQERINREAREAVLRALEDTRRDIGGYLRWLQARATGSVPIVQALTVSAFGPDVHPFADLRLIGEVKLLDDYYALVRRMLRSPAGNGLMQEDVVSISGVGAAIFRALDEQAARARRDEALVRITPEEQQMMLRNRGISERPFPGDASGE